MKNNEETLKKELCNELIKQGKVQEGDIVKHSYTSQIMSGNKKCVEKSNEMIALTTRGDCVGVCVKEPIESMFTEMDKALITDDLNIKRYVNSHIIDKFEPYECATTNFPNGYGHGSRVHKECVALTTNKAGLPITKVKVERERNEFMLRIRKLTPKECLRLMGFSDEDYEAMRDIGMSDSAIYHMAGDSLIVPLLASMIYPMVYDTNNGHIDFVNQYVEKCVIKNGKITDIVVK